MVRMRSRIWDEKWIENKLEYYREFIRKRAKYYRDFQRASRQDASTANRTSLYTSYFLLIRKSWLHI